MYPPSEGSGALVLFPYQITLKRSNGDMRHNLTIDVNSANDRVSDVLNGLWNHLRAQGIDERTKQVRMIYAGKLLQPPNALLSSFNVTPDAFVHFVVSDVRPHDVQNEAGTSSGLRRASSGLRSLLGNVGTLLFTSSNTESHSEEQDGENDGQGQSGSPGDRRARGLDVLQATHNLTIEEIQSLRAIFQDDISAFSRGSENQDRGEMETVWLLNQGAGSEFMANLPRRSSRATRLENGASRGEHMAARQDGTQGRTRLLARLRNTGTADFSPDSATPPIDTEVRLNEDIDAPGQTGYRSTSLLGMLMSSVNRNRDYNQLNNNDIEMGLGNTNHNTNDEDEDEDNYRPRSSLGNLSASHEVAGVIQGIDELGTSRDFIWGLVLGFSFGVLMLLCVFERSMNYRNKIGIIAGVMVQLILAISIHPLPT
jgi:hypothetical protein